MKPQYMIIFLLTFFLTTPALAQNAPSPNNIQEFMLYRSFVQDAPSCAVSVVNNTPIFQGATASSAAISCPDAFAWVQFTKAIAGEFWNWGIDQTVWPTKPKPLCLNGPTGNCCDPNETIFPNKQPKHCPVFRADYSPISPLPAQPNGSPSQAVLTHTGLVPDDKIDPGRLLRDLELEIVFRNKSMVDYIYRHDLYSKEGLGSRNRAQNTAWQNGDIAQAHAMEVRFPVDAVMVKADFLHQKIMLKRGLIQKTDKHGNTLNPPNNPDHPYLTVYAPGNGSKNDVPGLYYMLAMTNASKEIPIWHWYAMEHVANQGRCDYIGCNDSFGYAANGTAQPGANFGPSFIPPKIILNNDKTSQNDPLFDTGKVYLTSSTGEKITPTLQALFKGMGIGTAPSDPDPNVISANDPAWLNYRLKGTQTTFTTSGGVPTGTGATVTEGGFVNSASCATCHSQASVDENGNSGMQGVGSTWRPNLLGYNQVTMGSPDANWFYYNLIPSVTATQIDFVWGILNASCQKNGKNGACATYPKSPTIIPSP
jgi:hypothetical protein